MAALIVHDVTQVTDTNSENFQAGGWRGKEIEMIMFGGKCMLNMHICIHQKSTVNKIKIPHFISFHSFHFWEFKDGGVHTLLSGSTNKLSQWYDS